MPSLPHSHFLTADFCLCGLQVFKTSLEDLNTLLQVRATTDTELSVDTGCNPAKKPGRDLRRGLFLAKPRPCLWRLLKVHTHFEPAVTLIGGLVHLPLTQGDGVGVPMDHLLTDLLREALQ